MEKTIEYLAIFEAEDPELLPEPIRDASLIDAPTFGCAVTAAFSLRCDLWRSGFDAQGRLVRATGDLKWRIVSVEEVTPEVKAGPRFPGNGRRIPEKPKP